MLFFEVLNDLSNRTALDYFCFKQFFCHSVNGTFVEFKRLFDVRVTVIEGTFDILVHLLCHFFTVVSTDCTGAKERVLAAREYHQSCYFGHTVNGDHVFQDCCSAVKIVARTGTDLANENLFCSTSAKQYFHFGNEFVFLLEETLFIFRKMQRIAQRTKTSWNDGNLCHTCRTFGQLCHKGVAAFVVGNDFFLFFIDLSVLLFQTYKRSLDCFQQV